MECEELGVIVEAWREETSQTIQEVLRRRIPLLSFDTTKAAQKTTLPKIFAGIYLPSRCLTTIERDTHIQACFFPLFRLSGVTEDSQTHTPTDSRVIS
jgi:hypothetical protein